MKCANCEEPVQNPGDYLCPECVKLALQRANSSATFRLKIFEATCPSGPVN